jgi:hypothetical protein
MLIRPVLLNPSPSIIVLMLGGLVGSLLALSVMYSAPIAGWPALDALHAIGGVFTGNEAPALAIGAVVFLIGTVILLPLAASGLWITLPGREGGIKGTSIKAAVIGAGFWATVGAVLGIVSLVGNGLGTVAPGLMGLAAGPEGAILFLAASLTYGLAVAYVGFVEQGISPIDAIGWPGFTYASTGPLDLGIHRSGEPEVPGAGERPWRPRG